MKIQLFVRNDGSSLDYVGKSIGRVLAMDFDVHTCGLIKPVKDQSYAKDASIAIAYGLPRDMAWLKNYRYKIAGLVCETGLVNGELEKIRDCGPDEIWVPSKFCLDEFQRAGFTKLALIPHGIDPVPEYKGSEKPFNKVLMIFNSYKSFNYHVDRKGIREVLSAWKDITGVELVLRTKKAYYYDQYALDNVRFIEDRVPDLGTLYDQVDAVLCPSKAEGFGLVGLDALARGIPLISTKTGNDYLDDGYAYIPLALPLSEKDIKKSIEMLYNDYLGHKTRALEQREGVIQKWNWTGLRQLILNRFNEFFEGKYGFSVP